MKRRLFKTIAAVSAFLLLVICLMWARSHRKVDLFGHWRISRDIEGRTVEECRGALSCNGVITVGGATQWVSRELHDQYIYRDVPPPVARRGWSSWNDGPLAPVFFYRFMDNESVFGFAFHDDDYLELDGSYRMQRQVIQFPYWVVALLAAAMPMWWLLVTVAVAVRTARMRRLREQGLCVRCRYNLTGNISGKCLECGTVVPAGPTEKGATA